MSVQTAYPDTPAIGFNGMLAQQFSLRQVDSGLAATAPIVLGAAVTNIGTSDDAQYVAAIADGAVTGVAIYQGATEDATQYEVGASFPVLSKGRYWAIANGVLAVGAVVAYDPATGKVGAVSGGVTTLAFGKAINLAAADGDLIVVEVDF